MGGSVDYSMLGRYIRAARRSKGFTQETVSATVGISLAFYGHIERGTRKASLETIVRIFSVLELSLDEALLPEVKTASGLTQEKLHKRALFLLQTAIEIARLE